MFWHIYHLQNRPQDAKAHLSEGDGALQKFLLQDMKVYFWA